MSDWKKFKLGDTIEVKHGFAFKGEFFVDEPTDDILLTPGNFKIGGGFKSDKFKYYKGDYPKEYILSEGDILITMTDLSKEGDTLGYSAKIPQHNNNRYLHNQRLGKVQLKSLEINENFLYWILRTSKYHNFIVSSATGSTVKHTSPTRIYNYEFHAPKDISEQSRIASILSSLDDKIELNLQLNKTLEAIAKAIFKEWFVDFRFPGFDGEFLDGLPKGWRRGKLGEEFLVTMGQSPPGDSYNEKGEGMIFFQGKTDFGFRFPGNRMYTTSPNRMSRKFDTLISVRAPVGAINMALEDCCIGRGLSSVRHNSGAYSYTYYAMKNLEKVFKGFEGEGTVFGSINKTNYENIDLVVPVQKVIQRFENAVNAVDEKIFSNTEELKTLTAIRDILLPRLMTGKIRVND
jgi:type I restriction enzyme, S subunit